MPFIADSNGLYGLRGWDILFLMDKSLVGFNGLYGLRGWDNWLGTQSAWTSFNGLYGLRGWDMKTAKLLLVAIVSTAFMA